MGGAVSLALAIRGRVKLRGLMLIGSFGSTRKMRFWRRCCMGMIPLSSPWLARKLAAPLLRNGILFGRFSRAEADLLIPAKRFDYRYYCCAMRMLSRMNQIEAARQLKIPTLVIHGTHDIVLPIECGQELAGAIPGARFVSIAGGNHMFFVSHHEAANGAMADFIQNL
jgi:pimeloyl-ACP methyl ester carboxylesterase